jgi:peptidoglycan/xylan/chitin deacetylase (PgdA/CDA1 family)
MNQGVWKFLRYSGLYLLCVGVLAGLSSLLHAPYDTLARIIIILIACFVAFYFLDMTIPGINIFSKAITQLPKKDGKKTVALTFDDGPVEPYTRQILDILGEFGVKGTFFCIGENMERNPTLTKRIVEEGHTLGNHTLSHHTLPFQNKEAISFEIERTSKIAETLTGKRSFYLRPPKGYKSCKVSKIAKRLGYQLVNFSYPIFDVQNPPSETLVDRVLSRVKEGDILLMHDGYNPRKPGQRDNLIKALPAILKGIQNKGLEMLTLDEALEMEQPPQA